MAAEKAKRFSQSKKEHARSASHGAFFCWALLKGVAPLKWTWFLARSILRNIEMMRHLTLALFAGGVLCFLFVLPGDLTISLQSGSPVYGGVYLSFYFTAVLLYLRLIKSDPGFLTSEEHHSLLEDGEMRRRSKDRYVSGMLNTYFQSLTRTVQAYAPIKARIHTHTLSHTHTHTLSLSPFLFLSLSLKLL